MPEPLSRLMPLEICGTGSALPSRVLGNDWFIDRLDTTDAWIRERTGIVTRHVVSEGESTATLAIEASKKALADARLTPADIDLIVVATITGECPFPATACFVQEALGAPNVPCFDISAACSGFLYAFVTAAQFLQTGHYRNILVIGAETLTRITDYQDRASCILFGDGAGAAILTRPRAGRDAALMNYHLHCDGTGSQMLWVPAGGSRLPASQMTINERLHYMKMQGREVYKFAVKKMLEVVDETLAEVNVRPEQVAMVIPHQSNKRIIESAREKLALPESKMYTNIERCGNTSAASIAIGLDEVRKSGRVGAGDLVLMVAFGAGLTWASALLRL
ncbi:MAG: beta-ketoacyl-ACP synthase III [Phycisphaerae bacterium]